MKITSTNIATPTTILWNGKEVTKGIYKAPAKQPVHLGKHEVLNDEISDRKNHGGIYKACYLFVQKRRINRALGFFRILGFFKC